VAYVRKRYPVFQCTGTIGVWVVGNSDWSFMSDVLPQGIQRRIVRPYYYPYCRVWVVATARGHYSSPLGPWKVIVAERALII